MAKEQDKMKQRLDQLEQRVEELEHRLEPEANEQVHSKDYRSDDQHRLKKRIHFGEDWLNRIGISLLLIGVAFLFNYSIDQGWLVPPVRSAIGIIVGSILFYAGFKLENISNTFKQILLGGAIASYYLTGFATYQLYSFVAGEIVWVFMIAVTALSLFLSLNRHHQILSVVGTLGALGTPFMLYSGEGSIVGLILYLTLILVAASLIYVRKGWYGLLWSMACGGCAVLGVGIVNSIGAIQPQKIYELWALQAGVIIWMVCSWPLPVFTKIFARDSTYRWLEYHSQSKQSDKTIFILTFLIPLFTFFLTIGIWEMSMNQAGFSAFSIAALGGTIYVPLHWESFTKLAYIHLLSALVMLTTGLFFLLEGSILFIILTLETLALHVVASGTGDQKIRTAAHLLFLIVMVWLLNMLRSTGMDSPFLNMQSISQLAALAVGGLLIPRWVENGDTADIYRISCHIVFLMWLYQQFLIFSNGQAWVTIAWGMYAILLLLFGFSYFGSKIRIAGMATVFLVVGKLFLVDLSQLQAIWRILLFMGFGSVFLILGYWWQSRWTEGEKNFFNKN